MTTTLAAKRLFLTGGGSGIGRAVVLAAAADGARICVTDIDGDAAETVAAEARARGAEAAARTLDVTDSAATEAAVAAVAGRFGGLDAAVNAAGITGPMFRPILEVDPDEWQRVIGVNLTGLWHAMRAEVRAMRDTGGSIVNVSSVSGLVGSKVNTAYGASKHGVVGVTRCVALEYAKSGLRVNCVCPGWTETPMTAPAQADAARHAQIVRQHPLGRSATADEIAGLIVWLLSDASSFVTGAAYPIDGGLTAQ